MSRSRRTHLPPDRSAQELLRDFAGGELPTGVAPVGDRPPPGDGGRLSEASLRLLRIAALASVEAPTVLWVAHLDDDTEGIDLDDVAAVLLEIAPIIGGSRIVSAANHALAAARLVEEDESP
jgi:hypothetical protein